MDMEISITAKNGERCRGERHRFRIGVDSRCSTEFTAGESDILDRLTDAIVDHGAAKRAGYRGTLYLQVDTGAAGWRNVQNPRTGGVMGVNPSIVGQCETAETLFLWACNAVQMSRDIDVLASGLSRQAVE
jgi:hypothetical protein